ncbi:spermidine synthase [Erwinia billingiae]|uniref:spermidine synthase n=2 Tax=Erwinia TaxID=551 RepID=UPI00224619C9|nr:spermidine synthase [Erwinia billingiae]MCX0498329.1 spermidine synthase [Erwinia billingiae]
MALLGDFFKGSSLRPTEIIVLKVTDEYGDIIVADYDDYRVLRFEGINEQSKMLKSNVKLPVHNYIKAMLMAVAFTITDNVLVLGLGGGALVRTLNFIDNEIEIDVVELRKDVLSVARKCFSLPVSENISYHIEDAKRHLKKSIKHYDVIFSDLYSAFYMDPFQETESFLITCRERMNYNGWLVINYHEIPRRESPLHRSLIKIFGEVLFCRVPSGNVIIFAAKIKSDFPIAERRIQAERLLDKLGMDLYFLSKNIAPFPRP